MSEGRPERACVGLCRRSKGADTGIGGASPHPSPWPHMGDLLWAAQPLSSKGGIQTQTHQCGAACPHCVACKLEADWMTGKFPGTGPLDSDEKLLGQAHRLPKDQSCQLNKSSHSGQI